MNAKEFQTFVKLMLRLIKKDDIEGLEEILKESIAEDSKKKQKDD